MSFGKTGSSKLDSDEVEFRQNEIRQNVFRQNGPKPDQQRVLKYNITPSILALEF